MINIIEIIGLIGAICFAISCIPQMIKCIREDNANGISYGTIWLWLIAEIAMLIYAFSKYDYVLLGNYIANFPIVIVIGWFKYKSKILRTSVETKNITLST